MDKIKAMFVKNRLAGSFLGFFLTFLVVLFFLLQQPTSTEKVNKTDQLIEKERSQEVIREANTDVARQVPINDCDFNEKATELNTSEKLITYLNKYYLRKDAREVSVFAKKVLSFHGFQAVILRYKTIEGFINTVLVFRDGDTPRYIAVTDEGIKMFSHGWSFEDLFKAEEKRLKTEIVKFSIRPLDVFMSPEWEER